jgi:hypothetical protein
MLLFLYTTFGIVSLPQTVDSSADLLYTKYSLRWKEIYTPNS